MATMTSETVKLSKQSIEILKNFNTINSNLHIVPGQDQVTVSPMKNIMVKQSLKRTFRLSL